MLDKTYHPAEVEPGIYRAWEASGAFACHPDSAAQAYTIMMPPPNVTGILHMGHALTFTLQDILIRYHRMRGRDALWQPGTDHAGIATQMVVERQLAEEQSNRQKLGRAAFIERVWRWKAESGSSIVRQLRRAGRLGRLESRALHHGRGAVGGGAQGLRRAPQGWPHLSRQAARQLGPEAPHRDLRSRGRGSRDQGLALVFPVSGGGFARHLRHCRHHAARDDAGRQRRRRSSRG